MKKHLFLIVTLATLLLAPSAFAQGDKIQDISSQFAKSASAWGDAIKTAVHSIFVLLLFLDFAWTAVTLVIKQSDIEEWARELIQRIFFYGFGFALLTLGPDWAKAIVSSLIQLGGEVSSAAGSTIKPTPGGMFNMGVDLAKKFASQASFWSPVTGGGFILCAVAIVGIFAYIAFLLLVTMCEMYITLGAGVVVLGFGSSRWTAEYSRKYLTFALTVGIKYFVIIVVAGIGQKMIREWIDNSTFDDFANTLILSACCLVWALMIKALPNLVANITSGSALNGTSESIVASGKQIAAAAAGAAVTAATAGAGAVAAGGAAVGLAKAQGASGALNIATGAFKNLKSAAAEDLGGKLSGRSRHGSMGGRMAEGMQRETAAMTAANSLGGGGEGDSISGDSSYQSGAVDLTAGNDNDSAGGAGGSEGGTVSPNAESGAAGMTTNTFSSKDAAGASVLKTVGVSQGNAGTRSGARVVADGSGMAGQGGYSTEEADSMGAFSDPAAGGSVGGTVPPSSESGAAGMTTNTFSSTDAAGASVLRSVEVSQGNTGTRSGARVVPDAAGSVDKSKTQTAANDDDFNLNKKKA